MLINIEEDKVFKLIFACTECQYYYEGLAKHSDDDDLRGMYQRIALDWKAIHDVLKAQIEKGGEKDE